jgi:hypothetical protein
MKKKYVYGFMAVIAAGAISLAGVKMYTVLSVDASKIPELNLPAPGEELDVDLELKADTSNVAKTAPLYKVKKHTVTDAEFNNLVAQLGVHGSVMKDNEYVLVEEGKHLTHSLNTNEFTYDVDVQKPILEKLSDDEAKIRAYEILKQYNISTDNLVYNGITYETLTKGSEVVPLKQKIYFSQVLNNQPLYGVARVVVMLGEKGELVGLYNLKKDFEQVKNVPLKGTEKAFDTVKEKGIVNINHLDHKGTLNDVKLGYWASKDDEYVQPLYVFTGTTENNNKFFAYAPAIDDSLTVPNSNKDQAPDASLKINPPKDQINTK